MILTLTEKEHLVDNVWAFRFTPEGPFTWTAGQYVRVELPHDNPDKEGTKRWFTNSAAPYEGIMQITTRITGSTFKKTLSQLEPGDELQLIEAPEGDFTWRETEMPIVFVAGGIGVTPFRSILRQRAHEHLPLKATLIYSGRTDALPFKDEFSQYSQADAGFTVKYEIGQPLTAARLAEISPQLNESLIYLSGPEPMVEALGDALIQQGLPKAQLVQDFFPNYTEANY